MLIHISGFPGSGKTTLGEKIQRLFKNTIVYDTDLFIQHHTVEGKQLLALERANKNSEYRVLFTNTMCKKIKEFIDRHPSKIIIFVGSLDNFAPNGIIYKIAANYKFVLDVPLNELMKRYYLRIYKNDRASSKAESADYWKKIAAGTYNINGSKEIITDYKKYNTWHKKANYTFYTDAQIIANIKKIISNGI
jgi:adenylate kinase family enzyme